METVRLVKLRNRLSLAVRVLDAHTSEAPRQTGAIVALEGIAAKPVRKDDGWYLFTDLTEGAYRLNVTIPDYFPEQLDIRVNDAHSIVYVPLKAKPSFPFRENDTLIRVMFRDGEERPVAGLALTATVTTESCAKARLMPEQTEAGARELTVGQLAGAMLPGEGYLIQSRTGEGAAERCEIAEAEGRTVKLKTPLVRPHARGSLLLPVLRTFSSERGEAVIAFPGHRTKAFDVRLQIEGAGGRTIEQEVTMREGATVNLGTIRW
ncbi:MAG: hypothetical protein J7639_11155 [Paenibacillaceae bacterium]|nr:hypothetical protein [Paenibacillaceae bacterium]